MHEFIFFNDAFIKLIKKEKKEKHINKKKKIDDLSNFVCIKMLKKNCLHFFFNVPGQNLMIDRHSQPQFGCFSRN